MGAPQPAIYPLNFEGASLKDYQQMADTLHSEFGRLDGLLHNASLLGKITPFEQYDPALWEQVMQVISMGPSGWSRRCCHCSRPRRMPPSF